MHYKAHTGLLRFFFNGSSKSSSVMAACISAAGSLSRTVGPESLDGTEGSVTSGAAWVDPDAPSAAWEEEPGASAAAAYNTVY